jgi:hypothetical protein
MLLTDFAERENFKRHRLKFKPGLALDIPQDSCRLLQSFWCSWFWVQWAYMRLVHFGGVHPRSISAFRIFPSTSRWNDKIKSCVTVD